MEEEQGEEEEERTGVSGGAGGAYRSDWRRSRRSVWEKDQRAVQQGDESTFVRRADTDGTEHTHKDRLLPAAAM